jgi:hypothetical protein
MRRFSILSICLAIVLLTTYAFSTDVLLTSKGKRYHSVDCSRIANKATKKVSEEEAIAQGLTPARCLKKQQTVSSQINEEDLVFVTRSGKRYHRKDCPVIRKRDTSSISLAEAQAKGLKPCSKCFGRQTEKN